jgi:hypothetical protein
MDDVHAGAQVNGNDQDEPSNVEHPTPNVEGMNASHKEAERLSEAE